MTQATDKRAGTTSTIRAFHSSELQLRIADKQKQGYELVDQGYEGKRFDGSRWWAKMRYVGSQPTTMKPYTGQLPEHLSVVTMPLRKDRPEPPGPNWLASSCPECGQDAWERNDTPEIMALFTQLKKMCRECKRRDMTCQGNGEA